MNAKYRLQDLEDTLWNGVLKHIENGGLIKDNMWGISITKERRVRKTSPSKCCCLLGANLTTSMLKKHCNNIEGIKSGTDHFMLVKAVSETFDLTTEETRNIIDGFDGRKRKYGKFYQLGLRLRLKAQTLPQWRGSDREVLPKGVYFRNY